MTGARTQRRAPCAAAPPIYNKPKTLRRYTPRREEDGRVPLVVRRRARQTARASQPHGSEARSVTSAPARPTVREGESARSVGALGAGAAHRRPALSSCSSSPSDSSSPGAAPSRSRRGGLSHARPPLPPLLLLFSFGSSSVSLWPPRRSLDSLGSRAALVLFSACSSPPPRLPACYHIRAQQTGEQTSLSPPPSSPSP